MLPKEQETIATSADDAGGSRTPRWLIEIVLPAGLLAGLTAYCLAVSWRRWPDLLVDFGRELYIPWRLSEGALLYRDVDDFYGPLSQYANAGLFSVFGPGMMVLVWANVAVFVGIVALLYGSLRQAWRPLAALGASAVFIMIFGFSRFASAGSFNYAAPYAHETTHGMLVLVLLVAVLSRWGASPTAFRATTAGVLFGLTLVLKPEIALAGGVLTVAAVVMHGLARGRWQLSWLLGWVAGVLTPTLLFGVFFSRHMTWGEAWSAACRGWLNVVATRAYVGDRVQMQYLGLDAPVTNALHNLRAASVALVAIAWIAAGGVAVGRFRSRLGRAAVAVVMIAALLVAGFSFLSPTWLEVGRCLLPLALLIAGWEIARGAWCDGVRDHAVRLRILLALLGLTLMARMALNGRIYQFGFYQSAMAAVVVVAFLLGELPGWVGSGRTARATVIAGVFALIVPGVLVLTAQNRRTHSLFVYPVGEGRDQFLIFRPDFYPAGRLVAGVVAELRKLPPGQSLLVLPEGLMINYLARMPSPLPYFFYYSVVTEAGKERDLVARLAQNPPDWVMLAPRDLREYGIERYGERSGAGKDLLEWVARNYDSTGMVGGVPLDYQRDGVQFFRRKLAASR